MKQFLVELRLNLTLVSTSLLMHGTIFQAATHFSKPHYCHIFIQRYLEVVDISDKDPPPPNFFVQIDTDEDGKISKDEIDGYFSKMGRDVPDGLWENEDKDGDGFISWEEFSGPKVSGFLCNSLLVPFSYIFLSVFLNISTASFHVFTG